MLIAALGAFATLPDLDDLQIETAALGTELTPGLKISVVRASDGNQRTIGAVRDAVELIESTMGQPLPLDHVIVVADDRAVGGNSAGLNFGFAISMLHQYDRDVGYSRAAFRKG